MKMLLALAVAVAAFLPNAAMAAGTGGLQGQPAAAPASTWIPWQPPGPSYVPPATPSTPAGVIQVASALACRYDAELCKYIRQAPISFQTLGRGAFGEANLPERRILLDSGALTWPIDETASLLLHEATHLRDYDNQMFNRMSFQDACFQTETNALTEQGRFWLSLYPDALPRRSSFDASMEIGIKLMPYANGWINSRLTSFYTDFCQGSLA